MSRFNTPPHQGMTHTESYSQSDPSVARYNATNERLNPRLGLEAPLLDPLDPLMYPARLPMMVAGALGGLGKRLTRTIGDIPAAIRHGAEEFALATTPLYAVPVKRDSDAVRNWVYNRFDPKYAESIVKDSKGDVEGYLKRELPYLYDQFSKEWEPNKFNCGGLVTLRKSQYARHP